MCDARQPCDDQDFSLSRRGFLSAGAGTAASMAFLGGFALPAFAQTDPTTPPPNAISPDEALKRLMEGNGRYAANASRVQDFSAGRATHWRRSAHCLPLVASAPRRG